MTWKAAAHLPTPPPHSTSHRFGENLSPTAWGASQVQAAVDDVHALFHPPETKPLDPEDKREKWQEKWTKKRLHPSKRETLTCCIHTKNRDPQNRTRDYLWDTKHKIAQKQLNTNGCNKYRQEPLSGTSEVTAATATYRRKTSSSSTAAIVNNICIYRHWHRKTGRTGHHMAVSQRWWPQQTQLWRVGEHQTDHLPSKIIFNFELLQSPQLPKITMKSCLAKKLQ